MKCSRKSSRNDDEDAMVGVVVLDVDVGCSDVSEVPER